jgi:hypothetical protein
MHAVVCATAERGAEVENVLMAVAPAGSGSMENSPQKTTRKISGLMACEICKMCFHWSPDEVDHSLISVLNNESFFG